MTGSTDGFGLEAARQLVQRSHTVYLHARNQERAADAKAKCPGAAGVLIADLSSMAETRKLAEEAKVPPTSWTMVSRHTSCWPKVIMIKVSPGPILNPKGRSVNLLT